MKLNTCMVNQITVMIDLQDGTHIMKRITCEGGNDDVISILESVRWEMRCQSGTRN